MSSEAVSPALAALRDMPQKYIGGYFAGCHDSACNMGRHTRYCRRMDEWARTHATVLRVAEAMTEADRDPS